MGIWVTWEAKGQRVVSPVTTLGVGGLFASNSMPLATGQAVELFLGLPGGDIHVLGVVRDSRPGAGMGVEFTSMEQRDWARLQQLVTRLLFESRFERPRRCRFERVSRVIAGMTPLPLRSGLHT